MLATLAVYGISLIVLGALIWRQISRDERTINRTATRDTWDKGVVSLNEFRDRSRRREQHRA